MANPLLGQILGTAFSSAMQGRSGQGPYGGMGGGAGGAASGAALAGLVGSMMGRGMPMGRASRGGNRGMLLAMLLPFAMRWVQRNGGIGAVLERFRQKGYAPQTNSWLSTGPNKPLHADAIDNVVDREELSMLAKQLGVQEEEVSSGLAEILPEMADQLSPEGDLPAEADDALDAGAATLEKELNEIQTGMTA